mmetsp:Transcript_971/g.1278  ORF Transcript_971/g.1278 Transcript_971/m.1278 type:complete len:228 (+) Transcript_971:418-1101(+)
MRSRMVPCSMTSTFSSRNRVASSLIDWAILMISWWRWSAFWCCSCSCSCSSAVKPLSRRSSKETWSFASSKNSLPIPSCPFTRMRKSFCLCLNSFERVVRWFAKFRITFRRTIFSCCESGAPLSFPAVAIRFRFCSHLRRSAVIPCVLRSISISCSLSSSSNLTFKRLLCKLVSCFISDLMVLRSLLIASTMSTHSGGREWSKPMEMLTLSRSSLPNRPSLLFLGEL